MTTAQKAWLALAAVVVVLAAALVLSNPHTRCSLSGGRWITAIGQSGWCSY